VIDAEGKYVLPGAIDPHTHHGIYRGLEADAETESRSDLVGGVTTIGNYFRRGGSYEEIMEGYFAEAEPNYYHDYFFSLGLLSFEHIEEIPYIVEELGITSFKWYKNYKDVAPEKFGTDSEMHDDWADAFIQALAAQDVPTTLGHHSENMEITSALGDNPYLDSAVDEDQEYRDYDVLVDQFPDYAETQSMTASGSLARQHDYDDSFYAVHISAGRTADELAMLHDAGWDITGETCTHYLTLTAEECDERHNVNPPVRSKEDQETLWKRVADGTISCIGTDHCANLRDDKVGEDVPDSLPGFPSTATMLPLILSEGQRGTHLARTRGRGDFHEHRESVRYISEERLRSGRNRCGPDGRRPRRDEDGDPGAAPQRCGLLPVRGARGDRVADAHGRSRSGRLRGGRDRRRVGVRNPHRSPNLTAATGRGDQTQSRTTRRPHTDPK